MRFDLLNWEERRRGPIQVQKAKLRKSSSPPPLCLHCLKFSYDPISLGEHLAAEYKETYQSVQNFAASTISGTCKFDHITPVLSQLRGSSQRHTPIQGQPSSF